VADCLAGGDTGAALQALRAGQGTVFDPWVMQVAVASQEAMERAVRLAAAEARIDALTATAIAA